MSSMNDSRQNTIGFMISTPEPRRDSYLSKRRLKIGFLNILTFLLFILVLIFIIVSLISPYWLGMKEPWIERLLVPKQFQIDPDKHNAWIGLYYSCNTENQCVSGTPYDDVGWYKAAQVMYALGCVILMISFVMECVYVCCVAYISIPSHKMVYLISGVTMLGAIFSSTGLGIYGTSTLNNGILTPMSLNGPGGYLSWAYFIGIVGVGLSGIVSLLYLIDAMVKSGNKGSLKGVPYYYQNPPKK